MLRVSAGWSATLALEATMHNLPNGRFDVSIHHLAGQRHFLVLDLLLET
jgi:hypothetical protein